MEVTTPLRKKSEHGNGSNNVSIKYVIRKMDGSRRPVYVCAKSFQTITGKCFKLSSTTLSIKFS